MPSRFGPRHLPTLVLLATLVTLAASPGLATAQAVQVGALAPDFTLPRIDGQGDVTLSDYRGKVVVLDFWATWCGPCHTVMANLLAPMYERYEGEPFEIISIGSPWNDDTAAKQQQFATRNNYHWTKVFDAAQEAFGAYNVSGIPTIVVIDKAGIVRDYSAGAGGGAAAALVPSLLAATPDAQADASGAVLGAQSTRSTWMYVVGIGLLVGVVGYAIFSNRTQPSPHAR